MANEFPVVAFKAAGVARRARLTLALGAILFFAGGVAGCGSAGLTASSPDGGTSVGVGGNAGIALQGIFNAYCKAARSCCAKEGISTLGLLDCENQAPTHAYLTPLVDKGEMTINAAAIPACEAAYNQAAVTCTTEQIEAACWGLFVGLQDEDQPCGTALACKSMGEPVICKFVGNYNPNTLGVCHKIVHGKAGDPCLSSCWIGNDCSSDVMNALQSEENFTLCFEAEGLYCSRMADVPSTCIPLATAGESCAADPGLCGTLNNCDPSFTCTPPATLGQSCASTACLYSLTCGSDNTCTTWTNPFVESHFTCESYPSGL